MSVSDVVASLVVGSRLEVQHGGRWVLVRVTHEDWITPGAGTLFEGEPVRRLYVETVREDGARGLSWQLGERQPARLVEVGLFA